MCAGWLDDLGTDDTGWCGSRVCARLIRVLALGLLGQACLRLEGFLAIRVKTGLSSLGSGPEHLI